MPEKETEEEVVDTAPYVDHPPFTVPVEYNARDLLIYAVGIGSSDPRFVYENHPEFAAFPTYPICLTYKGSSYDTVPYPVPILEQFPLPPLRHTRVVLDAEKYIEKVNELPKEGARLNLVGGLLGVNKKGSGALVETKFDIVDDKGTVYYKIISGGFWVGARGFRDSGTVYSQAASPPKGVAPTHSVDVRVYAHAASIYRLSGDYNPLHIDPAFAKHAGFDRPILHGLCTLGHTTRAVLDALAGGDQRRFKSISMRFASPVPAGETMLVVEIWRVSATEAIFRTLLKETGAVVISNGLMRLNPAAAL